MSVKFVSQLERERERLVSCTFSSLFVADCVTLDIGALDLFVCLLNTITTIIETMMIAKRQMEIKTFLKFVIDCLFLFIDYTNLFERSNNSKCSLSAIATITVSFLNV